MNEGFNIHIYILYYLYSYFNLGSNPCTTLHPVFLIFSPNIGKCSAAVQMGVFILSHEASLSSCCVKYLKNAPRSVHNHEIWIHKNVFRVQITCRWCAAVTRVAQTGETWRESELQLQQLCSWLASTALISCTAFWNILSPGFGPMSYCQNRISEKRSCWLIFN